MQKNYSLIAPSWALIKYFLPIKNTIITGIEQIQEHAINSPQRVISLNEPLNIVKKKMIFVIFFFINFYLSFIYPFIYPYFLKKSGI